MGRDWLQFVTMEMVTELRGGQSHQCHPSAQISKGFPLENALEQQGYTHGMSWVERDEPRLSPGQPKEHPELPGSAAPTIPWQCLTQGHNSSPARASGAANSQARGAGKPLIYWEMFAKKPGWVPPFQ